MGNVLPEWLPRECPYCSAPFQQALRQIDGTFEWDCVDGHSWRLKGLTEVERLALDMELQPEMLTGLRVRYEGGRLDGREAPTGALSAQVESRQEYRHPDGSFEIYKIVEVTDMEIVFRLVESGKDPSTGP